MDGSDFLASIEMGELESISRDLKRALLRDNLDRLDNTGINLVLNTGEFSFTILTDDDNIDVLMTRSNSRNGEGRGNVGEETELLIELVVLDKLGSLSVRRDNTEKNNSVLF